MGEKRKILFVDDDEVHLLMAEDLLKEEYDIFTAESGKKALELIYKRFIPDLIILDIIMPDMDGWEAFYRLKSISFLNDVPIAFLTSLHGANDRKHAQELGAADFITKPFDKQTLVQSIENIFKNYKK